MQTENIKNVHDIEKLQSQVKSISEKFAGICATCKANHKINLSAAIVKNQVQIDHLKTSIDKITDALQIFNENQTELTNQLKVLGEKLIKINGDLSDIWKQIDTYKEENKEKFNQLDQKIAIPTATGQQLILQFDQLKQKKEKTEYNKNVIVTTVIASIIIGILSWLGSAVVNNIFNHNGSQTVIEKNVQQK